MGLFGGGPSAPAPAPVPPVPEVKRLPPPAQISGSLQAVTGQVNASKAAGGAGASGTVLTTPRGVRMPDSAQTDNRGGSAAQLSPAMLLYGKTMTGA